MQEHPSKVVAVLVLAVVVSLLFAAPGHAARWPDLITGIEAWYKPPGTTWDYEVTDKGWRLVEVCRRGQTRSGARWIKCNDRWTPPTAGVRRLRR